jgi:HSP20 family protein
MDSVEQRRYDMAVTRWTPWQELEAMERRMRRMFDEAWIAPSTTPNADVYETDDEFVVELEVPGYAEKDLEVEVHDHTLSVNGERSEEKEKKEKDYRLHERLERRFERRFTLPPETDVTSVKATYDKGVLEIHAPKVAEGPAKKVPISGK